MRKIVVAVAAIAFAAGSASAFSQTTSVAQPQPNAKKLSELIAKVEGRDKFQYISEIEWSQGGYYDVYYYTTDKAKVELDRATGITLEHSGILIQDAISGVVSHH